MGEISRVLGTKWQSYRALLDQGLVFLFFKFLAVAFLPAGLALFIASRIPVEIARHGIASLGFLWTYVVLLITQGFFCRMIFLRYLKEEQASFKPCLTFTLNFAPAYLVIPFMVFAPALLLLLFAFVLFFLGRLPFLGQIISGLLIAPVFVIQTVVLLIVLMGIYFAPAIIACEEEGVTSVFRRLYSFLKNLKLRLPGYFLVGMSAVCMVTVLITVFTGVIMLGSLNMSNAVLGPETQELMTAARGTFVLGADYYNLGQSFSYHIYALIFYLSMAIVAGLALTFPGLILCSTSTHMYRLLKGDEEEILEEKKKPNIENLFLPLEK